MSCASTGYAEAGERFARTLVDPDWGEKGALVGVLGEADDERIVGIGNYVRLRDRHTAEAAFAVADDSQRRGIGTRLVEQLSGRAAEHGIDRFVAEVMPENAAMLGVFERVGLPNQRALEDGVVEVAFPITPTEAYTARVDERDHVAVTASLRPFFLPTSVAVIGASSRRGSIGGELFRNVLTGDFTGAAYPVNRGGEPVGGVKAYTSIEEIPDAIDLAVICLPGDRVLEAAESALRHGTRALCVISAGFAEIGPEGRERQDELLALVRAHGARLVGPNCLGIASAAVGLNATFAPRAFPPWAHRLLLPERSARARAARARRGARPRRLGVRLDRQQGRRLLQRPARVVGGRRRDRPRADVRRVLREPAQVRAHRAAARAREAGARDEERPLARRSSRGGLAHRRAGRLGRRRRRALPPGRRDPGRDARPSCSTWPRSSRASRPRAGTASP